MEKEMKKLNYTHNWKHIVTHQWSDDKKIYPFYQKKTKSPLLRHCKINEQNSRSINVDKSTLLQAHLVNGVTQPYCRSVSIKELSTAIAERVQCRFRGWNQTPKLRLPKVAKEQRSARSRTKKGRPSCARRLSAVTRAYKWQGEPQPLQLQTGEFLNTFNTISYPKQPQLPRKNHSSTLHYTCFQKDCGDGAKTNTASPTGWPAELMLVFL